MRVHLQPQRLFRVKSTANEQEAQSARCLRRHVRGQQFPCQDNFLTQLIWPCSNPTLKPYLALSSLIKSDVTSPHPHTCLQRLPTLSRCKMLIQSSKEARAVSLFHICKSSLRVNQHGGDKRALWKRTGRSFPCD